MAIRIAASQPERTAGTVYDLEIEVCGETFFIRRSHALMRRLEQVAGPLQALGAKLEAADITQADLVRVYVVLLDDEKVAPTRAAIEAWVFDKGTAVAARAIALDIFSLTAGNQILRALTEAERKAAPPAFEAPPEDPEEAERNRPFSPVGALTGVV